MPTLNALTVDVEEYFHPNAMDDAVRPAQWDLLPSRVERNVDRVLQLLADHDVRATFFVLGWVAERFPHLVQTIAAAGHEIASHGYAHRLAYRLGPDGFRADVARGKAILEDVLGGPVHGYRAASYSIVARSIWALEILVEAGFAYDSSIFPVRHDLYGIPNFSRFPVNIMTDSGSILEIPASTVSAWGHNWPVAGGGYFRLLPYVVNRWAITHINHADAAPAIVYFHPWEIDADQPRLPVRFLGRVRHYTNLARTEQRLHRLLSDVRFGPLREAFDLERLAAAAPLVSLSATAGGDVALNTVPPSPV